MGLLGCIKIYEIIVNMKKNIVFIPPYYIGTSFEDIIRSFKKLVKINNLPIIFRGSIEPKINKSSFETFDSSEDILEYTKSLIILSKEKNISKILFIDFFAPGLDILKYVIQVQQLKLKMGALMHGGTFVPGDLYKWKWLKKSENLWFSIFDVTYAPSKYAKSCIPSYFQKYCKVFPWGLDYLTFPKNSKKVGDIIFPHRLEKDKGVADLIWLIKNIPNTTFTIVNSKSLDDNKYFQTLKQNKNVRFIIGESGKKHLKTLSSHKIVLSTAKQETFGYSIMKAIYCGCIPVLPNKNVYPEFFNYDYLYKSKIDAKYMIQERLNLKKLGHNINSASLINNQKPSFLPLLLDFFELS